MEIINVEQGTPEWHAHRRTHLNASDVPAMMGLSPYTTRSELVAQVATGIYPEVSHEQQRLFDKGHRFERLARPLAEKIIGEELAPLVGAKGKYSASFDGLPLMSSTGFEHKMLNNALREAMVPGCTGADLPLMYQVQMEQQCMVGDCDRELFMASNWDDNDQLIEERHCWYAPNLELRARILAEWDQFEADVAAYVPEVKPALPVAVVRPGLPYLSIEAKGEITTSNLDTYKVQALQVIADIADKPATDQQFAQAKADGEYCRGIQAAAEAAKVAITGRMTSVDAALKILDQIAEAARLKALACENAVEAEEKRRKAQMVLDAQKALADHVEQLNKDLGAVLLRNVVADFAGAIKGKRKVENMQDAVDTLLSSTKAAASSTAARIAANLVLVHERQDLAFLFPDVQDLVLKAPDDLRAVVQNRITQHEQAEAKRKQDEEEQRQADEAAAAARAEEAARPFTAGRPLFEPGNGLGVLSIDAAAPTPAPAVVQMPVRSAAPEPAPMTPPSLKLGDIAERLGFALPAAFLKTLGFEPAGKVGAHGVYHEAQFPQMCAALVRHIEATQAKQAA